MQRCALNRGAPCPQQPEFHPRSPLGVPAAWMQQRLFLKLNGLFAAAQREHSKAAKLQVQNEHKNLLQV